MKNIMSGKKKFTMFAITAVTALINAYVADPAQSETLTQLAAQYIPTLIVFAGSIFGVNREAKVDVEREKTKQAQATSNQVALAQTIDELRDDVDPIIEAQYEPFDAVDFAGEDDKKLNRRAAQTYLEINPLTVFFAAQSKGKITRCKHIDQALSYWDFLHRKALEAFDHLFGFPFEEAGQHLADDNPTCPYYSVDNMARERGIHFWTMLKSARWVIRKQNDLERLADTDIQWQNKLATQNQSLYGLGQLASEIVKTA